MLLINGYVYKDINIEDYEVRNMVIGKTVNPFKSAHVFDELLENTPESKEFSINGFGSKVIWKA